MRRAAKIRTVAATCVVATAFGLTSGNAAARSLEASAAQCTYSPELPALIVVNKPTVTFHTPVKITAAAGVDCRTNFGASESLVHGSDSYFLSWLYNSTTSTNSILPITVVPGRYATTSKSHLCSVTSPPDGSHPTCAVGAGATTIKFGGKASLSATRLTGSKKNEVRFTARAAHYDPYSTIYITTKVSIQRYYSGAWHTIDTATASGSKGFVFTYTDADAAHYRAVSTATGAVTGAVSGTVTV